MRITFSIPAHNEEKEIGSCLQAILKDLETSGVEAEIVVVDNASTDKTAEIAGKYPGVRVVYEAQKGLLFARQRGFLESHGDLLANIDSDVRIIPGWTKKVLYEFQKNPHLVGLSGPFIYYDLSLFSRIITKVFYSVPYLIHSISDLFTGRSAFLQGGNFVVRRDALEKVGGFNTKISFYGEDTEVAKRLSRVGREKFSFGLPVYTSGRRLKNEGVFMTGLRYAINHFWIIFFDRPYTWNYKDIRPSHDTPHKK